MLSCEILGFTVALKMILPLERHKWYRHLSAVIGSHITGLLFFFKYATRKIYWCYQPTREIYINGINEKKCRYPLYLSLLIITYIYYILFALLIHELVNFLCLCSRCNCWLQPFPGIFLHRTWNQETSMVMSGCFKYRYNTSTFIGVVSRQNSIKSDCLRIYMYCKLPIKQ